MPPTILRDYHTQLLDTMREYSSSFKWWSAPLNLGGSSGSSGGSGVPLGGIFGQLIQSKIAYDTTELMYSGLPVPSGASILDNLAHIRYDIATLSGGLSEVREAGTPIITEATVLDFDAEFDITDEGVGVAGIGYGTLQRTHEDRDVFRENEAIDHWRSAEAPNSEGVNIGYQEGLAGVYMFQINLKGDDFGHPGVLAVGSDSSTYWRDRFIDIDGDLTPSHVSIDRLFGIISTPSIIPSVTGKDTLVGVYGRADIGKTYSNPASGIAFLAETSQEYKAKYGHFHITYGLYVADQDQGIDSNYAVYTNLGLVSFGDTVDMRGNDIINIGDDSLVFESGVVITSSGILALTDGGETALHSHAGSSIDHGELAGLDTGADHSWIDQDVQIAASPTFANVHVFESGALYPTIEIEGDSNVRGSLLKITNNADLGFQIFAYGTAKTGTIGGITAADAGIIYSNQTGGIGLASAASTNSKIILATDGSVRWIMDNSGNVAFQQASTISTTAGSLILDPFSGNVMIDKKLGIGEATPARSLEIGSPVGGITSHIALLEPGGGTQATISVETPVANALLIASTTNIQFFTGAAMGTIAQLPTNLRLKLTSVGNLAFQQASTISTTAGDLTLSPANQVYITTFVGVGRQDPKAKVDVFVNSAGFDATQHLSLSNQADTLDNTYAGTVFATRTSAGQVGKSWFGVEQTANYGRGDFIWLLDAETDDNTVALADEKLRLTNAGSLQFNQASTISTTAGDLTLSPADDVIVTTDLTFVGAGSGLQYGSCCGMEIEWIQANAVQNQWYDVSDADMVDGKLNGITHDGNGQLTISTDGMYMADWAGAFEADAVHVHILIAFSVNGTEVDAGMNHFATAGTNREESCAGNAILELSANDTVNISIRTTDAGTPDLLIDHLMIRLVQIGGA